MFIEAPIRKSLHHYANDTLHACKGAIMATFGELIRGIINVWVSWN